MLFSLDNWNRFDFPEFERDMLCLRTADSTLDIAGRDILDDGAPLYVISFDDEGEMKGGLRLLQTLGPHFVSALRPDLIGGDHAFRSVHLWEASRASLHDPRDERTFAEVLVGAMEIANRSAVEALMFIVKPETELFLRRLGFKPNLPGRIDLTKSEPAAVWMLDVSDERIEAIKEKWGFPEEIWATPEQIGVFEERSIDPDPAPYSTSRRDWDIKIYCEHQISTAQTEEERKAALALSAALRDFVKRQKAQ